MLNAKSTNVIVEVQFPNVSRPVCYFGNKQLVVQVMDQLRVTEEQIVKVSVYDGGFLQLLDDVETHYGLESSVYVNSKSVIKKPISIESTSQNVAISIQFAEFSQPVVYWGNTEQVKEKVDGLLISDSDSVKITEFKEFMQMATEMDECFGDYAILV